MQRIPWGPCCWESGELCCHWRVRPSPPGVPAEAAVSLPGDLVEPGLQDWRADLRPGSSASGLGICWEGGSSRAGSHYHTADFPAVSQDTGGERALLTHPQAPAKVYIS